MLQFHYSLAPNPMKVALFLEEAEIPYTAVPVDTRRGAQHEPDFVALNPNAKVPVIVEDDGTTVFDSNAILLYLAEKTGRFLPPAGHAERGALLSWLMFVATGIGPYSGQHVHFKMIAPEPKEYAARRYAFEARRHWNLIDARLATHPHMLGEPYTIVDMAVWGWARALPLMMGDDAWTALPNVKRLWDEINARPAAHRVEALRARHAFKTEWDEDARRHMFPHLAA